MENLLYVPKDTFWAELISSNKKSSSPLFSYGCLKASLQSAWQSAWQLVENSIIIF